jgi:hypothetical protein
MLAPGRARLGTMPAATGSVTPAKHDGDGCRRPLGGQRTVWRPREKHVNLQSEHLSNELGKALDVPFRESRLDQDILAFDVTYFPQTLQERFDRGTGRYRGYEPDSVDPGCLLSSRSEHADET